MFMPVREFSHEFLARMTQIDYAREMAFIALRPDGAGDLELLGVARFFADPDYEKAEYAVLVRSDLKGLGLGWLLMQHLISYAKSEGLKTTLRKRPSRKRQHAEDVPRAGLQREPQSGGRDGLSRHPRSRFPRCRESGIVTS